MTHILWIGALGAMLILSPIARAQDQKPSPTARSAKSSGMSDDMRQAIEWERAKDRAAARQARIEARHPSHFEANRTVDDQDTGRKVKDTKAPGAKRDQ